MVGAGVEKELLDLVAADIAEDAAILLFFKEPGRARSRVEAVGAHADDLHHPADGPRLDQFPGVHRRLDLQALAVADGVLAAGLGHDVFDHRQLFQGGQRRFVGEIVLARAHHAHPQRRALGGHAGAGHQFDGRVGQHLFFAFGQPDLRVTGFKRLHLGRVRVVHPFQRRPGVQQAVGHAVDVPVVEADGRKRELPFLDDRRGDAFWCVVHTIFLCHDFILLSQNPHSGRVISFLRSCRS